MALANGIELWRQRKSMSEGYGDLSALYTAGVLVQRGQGRSLYDRREQWRVQQEFAPAVAIRKGPMPYIRPPFEALLFVPLAWLPYSAALAVWSLFKLALLYVAVAILPRPSPFARTYPVWLEVALCCGLFPVFLDFLQGQDAILLLLIVAATLNRLHAGKDVAAGATLALGLFKFHLVLPVAIVLWLSGRARILAGFVPVSAALIAISCVVSGVSVPLAASTRRDRRPRPGSEALETLNQYRASRTGVRILPDLASGDPDELLRHQLRPDSADHSTLAEWIHSR